jgi:hypothetical protein
VLVVAALLAASNVTNLPKLAHLSSTELAAVSDQCHSPRNWLRYSPTGELHIRPGRTAKYQQVDCILGKLKLQGAQIPMGFVGNELPSR